MDNFHAKTKEEILKEFDTSEKGLSQEEAESRLKKYGKNEIKEVHKLRPIRIFFEQFKSFLIYILLIAMAISFFIGHMIDATVILVITMLNVSIGFFQQYKAERAIIALKKILIPTSKVIRDEKYVEIPYSEIVPGDIILFGPGDKVNADCRILTSKKLQTNEAILTGESLPILKLDKILSEKVILAERINMLFTGTEIVAGSGSAIVVATGAETEFGKIASGLQEIEVQKTPMQKRIDVFSKQFGLIILGIILIILLLGIFKQFDKFQMFLTAVALAVSSIPEGLPAVLAISFAISSLFMSKKNVLIKKLPAVESLGSVTVICSDKTGTLTEEKMQVQKIFVNNQIYNKKSGDLFLKGKRIDLKKHTELFQTIKTSILCNNARYEKIGSADYSFIGDPTEQSLVRMALDLEISKKQLTEEEPRIEEFEFDSEKKMMSILRASNKNNILYSKGASEVIIAKSSHELINGQIKKLNDRRKKELLKESSNLEKEALRVLAFAYKPFSKISKLEVKEKDLIFLGFIGMIDPPRKEVADAIKQCKNAGIKVKMITGDSILTAKAISKQIGIEGKIITGQQLEDIRDNDLIKIIDDIAVFARITPQQKLKIAKTLQLRGEIVAITGDGINDVLALKVADIGIAMGQRGTDVARDTADIILMDDNFASIVDGAKEGRKTYDNIKKVTKFLLAVNFSEILMITVTILMGLPLPLLPLQILWMNLITDSLPAMALVFEKEENVMKTPPRKEKSILSGILGFILIGGLLHSFVSLMIYFMNINIAPIELVRGMVLTSEILFELFFIYTCRVEHPLIERGIFSNKWLNYAVITSLMLHLIIIYTPLAGIFGIAPLTFANWMLLMPLTISGLIIFEIRKHIKFRNKQ